MTGSGSVVAVEHDAEQRETRYRVTQGDCRIVWQIRAVEPQVILHRADCMWPLSEQAPLIAALWLALPRAAGSTWLLFWGRMCPDFTCGERQLSRRLALAAYRSDAWDARRGRPTNGHENPFVWKLANEAMIYPELRKLFERLGYRIELHSVEKVLVAPVSVLRQRHSLDMDDVPAEARLPYDAMTWFRLTPSP